MRLLHGLSLSIGILLASLFAWLFIQEADWHSISEISTNISIAYLALALFPLGFGYAARVWRWHFLLKQHNPDLKIVDCLTPYFSAFALNNILPFRLGDLARITLFNQQLKTDSAAITSTLLVERMIDFISLLLVFSVSVIFISISLPEDNTVFQYIFIVAISAVIFILLFLVFPSAITQFLTQLDLRLKKWQMATASRMVGFVRQTSEGIHLHNNFRSLLILFSFSLCIWIAEAAIFWLVAKSIGIWQHEASSFFVMSLSTFSTLLPSTPGYIGTFHYLCRQSVEWMGFATNLAISYALLIHLVIVFPVTLLGLFSFIHHFGTHWKNRLQAIWRTV